MYKRQEQSLEEVCKTLEKNLVKVLEKSQQQVIANEYNANTKEALTKGIFGAPSFTVENEIFWGDDRLEDCIKWIKLQRE